MAAFVSQDLPLPDVLLTLKIQVYRLLFPLGCAIALLAWTFDLLSPDRPVLRWLVAPMMIAVLIPATFIVYRRPKLVLRVEPGIFALLFVLFLLQFYEMLLRRATAVPLDGIEGFPQWIPTLYFLAFFTFSTQRAIQVSAAFLLAALIPAGVFLWLQRATPLFVLDVNALFQIYASNILYIFLIYGFALVKERYVQAALRAEIYERVASLDVLTHIANRRGMEHALRAMVERAEQAKTPFSLILFDVDHFKRINDTYGHDVGDRTLIEIARRIGELTRPDDRLGRWGGEEFLLLAPQTDATQAVLFAERLRLTIATSPLTGGVATTASFGVATWAAGDTMRSLITRADAAMYAAKRDGRDRVAVG